MLCEPFPFKRSVTVTAAQRRYHAWILQQPCIVTGRYGVTKHHVTAGRDGAESVERLSHGGFYETHGVDLEAAALHTLVRYLETENV
jgi:hypothetical protein